MQSVVICPNVIEDASTLYSTRRGSGPALYRHVHLGFVHLFGIVLKLTPFSWFLKAFTSTPVSSWNLSNRSCSTSLAGHRGDGAGESGYVEFQPPSPVASVAVVVSGSCTVASSLLAQAVSPKRRTRLRNHATIFSFYSPFLSPFPSRVLLFQCTVFSIPPFRNCDRVFFDHLRW